MNTIEGTVEEVIFTNESNGYAVCALKCEKDIITVVGYIPFIREGETLRVMGKWTSHPDYGEQLKVEYFEKIEPKTASDIEKYLSSGIVKGIGPSTAKKIVDRFMEDTISVIENQPHMLACIKGISMDKAISIHHSFMEQRDIKQVVMFLQQFDIGPSLSVKIFKRFGNNAIEEIKTNPYMLSDEIFGIGFKTADKIAMKLGIDKGSEYRICAGIKYVLSWFCNMGHTFIPKEQLIDTSIELLDTYKESIENALIRLTIDKQIFIEEAEEGTAVYLSSFYYAEIGVVKRLIELSKYSVKEYNVDVLSEIKEIENETGIELEKLQKEAIVEAFKNGVLVITGGPGTGKTTIINTMLKIFDKLKLNVALTAPTGRASKRMTEACGKEAKTIHRLLEFGFVGNDEQDFARNQANPLEYHAIIVDEMSMVDILLMNSLLKAIMPGTILILVGDTDQLPSVGPGKVLKDIINSDTIKVVRLTEIFRQASQSMIIVNAHRINRGETPYLNSKEDDFFLIRKNKGEDILNEIIGLITERLPGFLATDSNSIQIITPMRKGGLGVISLNNELQQVLNPHSKKINEKVLQSHTLREGDKVMQIKNNYNMVWENINTKEKGMGVFNGDIGYIQKIDNELQVINVLFDEEKEVLYDFAQLDELELAYAITVHKSQGSEFDVIIMPVLNGPPMLMTRNLLYTAITRAKKLVVMVGKEECMVSMINNNNESKRYSGLKERLMKFS